MIHDMSRTSAGRQTTTFGAWLDRQLRLRNMNQTEFAERLGVSPSTVSRWVKGRVPEAVLLERVADVLVVDYDLVATQAGVRPAGIDSVDPDSPEAVLLAVIRRIDWKRDPRRLKAIERQLRWLIEEDQEEKQ